jgi:hypothetical protein
MQHDRFRAGEYAPDYEEQNELAMVVQVVIDVWFQGEPWKVLNAVGFGATEEALSVPFVSIYLESTVRRLRWYLRDANLRYMISRTQSDCRGGLRATVNCEQHWRQVEGDYSESGDEFAASQRMGES